MNTNTDPNPKAKADTNPDTDAGQAPNTPHRRRNRLAGAGAFACVLALLLVSAVGFTAYIETVGIKLEKEAIYPESGLTLATIPSELPANNPVWIDTGQRDPISKEVEAALGTSNHVTRYYRLNDTDREQPLVLQLHAAYYTGLIDTVPHVPERCFVGGGLTRVAGSTTVVDIPLDIQSRFIPDLTLREETGETIYKARGIEVPNRVRLPRNVENLRLKVTEFSAGENRSVFAGYFFIANGTTVVDAERVRAQAFDLKQDYAYYMKVQFMSSGVDSAQELARYAGSMLNEIFGELMLRCPDWIEVERGQHPQQIEDRT